MENRKTTFLILSQFVHHHLLLFLVGAYSVAAISPGVGLWIRNVSFGDVSLFQNKLHVSLLLLLLATLMFNAGLGMKTEHVKALAHQTGVLVAGLTANVLIPITYIFFVSLVMRLWYEPEEAQDILVGLALVAAMPIAG